MKRYMVTILVAGFALQAHASEIIPPRMAVRWLIEASQNTNKAYSISSNFTFDKKKHGKLTRLSRNEQLAILKKLKTDKLKFDKDEYHVDRGTRFVVRLLAPEKLDFEIEAVSLKGTIGPPMKYVIIAIRRTAQQKPSQSLPGS